MYIFSLSMPYYTANYRRGKNKGRGKRKPKPWYDQQYSAWQLAKKAWDAAKYIKGLVNTEYKYCDASLSSTAIDTSGSSTILSSVVEGSDYNQRDGISIKAKSIFLRGNVTMPASATGVGQRLRLILVRDNEDSTPSFGDLLDTVSVLGPLNHVNTGRFTVLWDHTVAVSNGGSQIVPFKKYISLNNHVKFSNSTTGIKTGHMYLFYISDGTTATTKPLLEFYSRMRFIDN